MAKSLRSKKQRKNRAILRKTVFKPVEDARLLEIVKNDVVEVDAAIKEVSSDPDVDMGMAKVTQKTTQKALEDSTNIMMIDEDKKSNMFRKKKSKHTKKGKRKGSGYFKFHK